MTHPSEEREHPIFRRIRALQIFHRTVLALVALAAGRFLGLATRPLPRAEGLLVLLGLATLALVVVGLHGFAHLRPWCMPVLVGALALCAVPLSRQVDVVARAIVGGQQLTAQVRLLTLDAPTLFVSQRTFVDLVPLALIVWLMVIRGVHRRVAIDHPLAAEELRPRRLAVAVCAVLAVTQIATNRPPARVPVQSSIGEAAAVTAVRTLTAAAGDTVVCARSSAYLGADLVAPSYLVVFVVESDRPDVTGYAVAHVHAGTGKVRVLELAPVPAPAAELCDGLHFEAEVKTRTRPPLTSAG